MVTNHLTYRVYSCSKLLLVVSKTFFIHDFSVLDRPEVAQFLLTVVDSIEVEFGFLKQMLIGYNAVIWTNYRTLNCHFSGIIFFSIRKILAKLQSSMSRTSSRNVP